MHYSAGSTSSSVLSIVKMENQYIHNGQFHLDHVIGAGSYGVIFLGKDTTKTPQAEVAIKLETNKSHHAFLLEEIRFLNVLKGGEGIPRIIWSGKEREYTILVMDLLGPSLHDLFYLCSRQFTMKTVLQIADQLITRLEYIHSKGVLHRDLKPDNVLVGTGESSKKIFLIDFGLAKKFIVPSTGRHIPFSKVKHLTGTMRFASINSHLGFETSRRDDMESLGYVLLHFLRRGHLPWQGIQMKGKTVQEKLRRVRDLKMGTSLKDLCKNLPEQFIAYFKHCRSLKFDEQPNYDFLRKLFRGLAESLKIQYDSIFDWSSFSDEIMASVRYSVSVARNRIQRNSAALSSNNLLRGHSPDHKAFTLE